MKYPFYVFKTSIEGHEIWIAKSSCLKGCVGQGETADEALAELAANENEWLSAAEEFEIPIPPIPVEAMNSYSGKFTVRVAPHVHRTATELAKNQDISLNQYVNDAIVAMNSQMTTVEYVGTQLKNFVWDLKNSFTENISTFNNSSSANSKIISLAQAKYQISSNPEGQILAYNTN